MWVDVDGGRLYVLVAGDGPPLLLLHGWPLDHRMFAPQIDSLSADFSVIAPDRRGFGRSTAPPDLRLELDDIDRVLDALHIRRAHVLGMSQGGRIAIRYAVTRPERLHSLLLQGAVIDGLRVAADEDERVPVAEFAALAKDGRLDEVKRRWLAHPMMALDAARVDEAALIQRIVADYTGADLVDYRPDRYAVEIDVPAALDALRVPVLLLTGADETGARRRHAREILTRVSGARETVFANSGHLSNLTEPVAYNRAVRDFCLAVDGAPVRKPHS